MSFSTQSTGTISAHEHSTTASDGGSLKIGTTKIKTADDNTTFDIGGLM